MGGELGNNIRKLRKERKSTLKDISQSTNLTISFLSQLERGKSSATLESIKKISLALDVTPSYFFDNYVDTSLSKENTLNVSEQSILDKHGVLYKSLSNHLDKPIFSPLYVILKPGQSKGDLIQHPGQEFIYVLKGRLTIKINSNVYYLTKNEHIMFDSNKRHYWYNYSEDEVCFLCINYDDNSI